MPEQLTLTLANNERKKGLISSSLSSSYKKKIPLL